jgi:DNA-directed RNA polymerase specialized sigma24 family protein
MAERIRQGRFLISPVDRLGRKIDPVVLAAAEEIGRRAVEYGEELLRDPALATSLLEESAALATRAIRAKHRSGMAGIRNLNVYLFRAFVRRVNKVKLKEPTLVSASEVNLETYPDWADVSKEFHRKVVVDEFLTRCDPITRDMFYRRVQGFSWKEIGEIHGISTHAAESRFSQAVQRVRKKLGMKE